MDFVAIDQMKKWLDDRRPVPPNTLKSLRDNLLVEWTYHSNAIEGNTMSISETRVVLEGITVGGKSIREHLEIINHRDAILFLEDLVKENAPLSEWNIRNIHRLVLKSIDDENAGVYRHENVLISGARHKPPDHFLVRDQMEAMVHSYDDTWHNSHPIQRAALLHVEFVKIHPFIDGNGRTARLLLNFELMKCGYPPTVIKAEMRPRYFDSLDLAHTAGDYGPFMELVSECVTTSFNLWMGLL